MSDTAQFYAAAVKPRLTGGHSMYYFCDLVHFAEAMIAESRVKPDVDGPGYCQAHHEGIAAICGQPKPRMPSKRPTSHVMPGSFVVSAKRCCLATSEELRLPPSSFIHHHLIFVCFSTMSFLL